MPTPDALKQQYHALRDVLARYRELREDHLRYLVKCGVLRPVLTSQITQAVGRHEQGTALGISGSLNSLAMVLAPVTDWVSSSGRAGSQNDAS